MASVKRRGSSYLIRVYAGYDTEGRQIEHTLTWHPPADMNQKTADKEAQHQAALFEEKIRNGLEARRNIKFADFAEIWFEAYTQHHRLRTIYGNRDLWERIKPELGHIPLDKIRPYHIMDFYKKLTQQERKGACTPTCDIKNEIKLRKITQADFSARNGVSLSTLGTVFHGKPVSYKIAERIATGLEVPVTQCFKIEIESPLSSTTIKGYHQLIHKMLEDAVAWQYITYNPCARVTAPKAAQPAIACLDDVQAAQLIELLLSQDGMYRRPIYIMLLTGLRRGELLGLEWQDVDWEHKLLQVRRTSQYLPQTGVFTDETKNKSSNRQVAIPQVAIDILREQQAWQSVQHCRLGDKWIEGNRIFTMEDGRLMRPDTLTHWFRDFIDGTDLPPIHIHSLRHTYATLSIADNVPLTAVAAQLGHANVWTTAKTYAHSIHSAETAAAEKVGARFAQSLHLSIVTDK